MENIIFISDFSLTQWYTDTGYKATTTLTGNPLTDILEELGIVRYYETSECNRTLLPYQPTEANGWNIGKALITLFIVSAFQTNLFRALTNRFNIYILAVFSKSPWRTLPI